MELLVGVLVAGVLAAAFVYLRRARADVLDYHGIETPQITEATHGGGGGGGGGGR